jgi:hypothetical protein
VYSTRPTPDVHELRSDRKLAEREKRLADDTREQAEAAKDQ